MKITGIILIVVGSLLLIISLIGMIFGSSEATPHIEGMPGEIAFYIGYNVFNILGVILLIAGILIKRKAIRKQTNKKYLIDSLPGNQTK